MKKRQVVGWKVPCKKGKTHRTNAVTGICRECNKQIEEPKPWMRNLKRQVTRMVFGS